MSQGQGYLNPFVVSDRAMSCPTSRGSLRKPTGAQRSHPALPTALPSIPVCVLQNKLVRERPEVWRAGLRQLVPLAQQQRDDRMLRNPYLQMSAMLDAGLPDVAF